jgi:hypothetical protein
VSQKELLRVTSHGRQLPHGLQSEEESAIHVRDSNIGSGTALPKAEFSFCGKAEVFTLR